MTRRPYSYFSQRFPPLTQKPQVHEMDTEVSLADSARMSQEQLLSLTALPTELHLLIAKHLTYPDALSLKHTNKHFYNLVYTGVDLKVEWLIKRRRLHLDCPNDKNCELGSDMRFCRGSVELLMKRRREHGECETRPGGRGCLVQGTSVCEVRREKMASEMLKRRFGSLLRERPVVWCVLLGLLGVAIAVAIAQGWTLLQRQSVKIRRFE